MTSVIRGAELTCGRCGDTAFHYQPPDFVSAELTEWWWASNRIQLPDHCKHCGLLSPGLDLPPEADGVDLSSEAASHEDRWADHARICLALGDERSAAAATVAAYRTAPEDRRDAYRPAVIERVAALTPQTRHDHLLLAELHRRAGDFDTARVELDAALQLGEDPLALFVGTLLLREDTARYRSRDVEEHRRDREGWIAERDREQARARRRWWEFWK